VLRLRRRLSQLGHGSELGYARTDIGHVMSNDQMVLDVDGELHVVAHDAGAAARTGVRLSFIQPGKPIQNAFVESFIGRFLDECLNPGTGSARSPRPRGLSRLGATLQARATAQCARLRTARRLGVPGQCRFAPLACVRSGVGRVLQCVLTLD
jgi:hypothetical protein